MGRRGGADTLDRSGVNGPVHVLLDRCFLLGTLYYHDLTMPRGRVARPFDDCYVVTPSGCWEWARSLNGNGYGHLGRSVAGKKSHHLAHRFSYERVHGPIPDGLTLDHLCRNIRCVNPAHLEPVTQRVNNERGNVLSVRYGRRTHCAQGHPYDARNTHRKKDGSRRCRVCERRRMAARRLGCAVAELSSTSYRPYITT